MNDIDFEEKLLLSSLHHQTIQHQPLNLPENYITYTSSENRQNRYNDYDKHRRDYNKQHYRTEPSYTNDNHNLVTTVSMSTDEDMLDDFELNFEGDQPNIVDTSNTIQSNNNTLLDHTADTATVVTLKSTVPKSSDEKNFVVTPELPRNITMDTHQLSTMTASAKSKQTRQKQRKTSPSRKKKIKDEPSTRVEVPKNEDILCGQSRVCASHSGNQTFQQILGDYVHRYDIATSKQEKMQMTKAVVSIIHESGGRFLKYKDGMWEEISTVAARDKVSHALRTKVSSWKRQHQQLLQKEKDPFAPPKRTSLSRQSRKRSIRDVGASPTPFEQESSKFNSLLQSQQANFANMTTPAVSPSRHHVRHSYAGEFYQTHHNSIDNSSNHSRRSSSTF